MLNKPTTQADLQNLEHANKILAEHLELVQQVVNQSEGLLDNYVPILQTYILSVGQLQNDFGKVVAEILKSTRELTILTGNTHRVIEFTQAIVRLNDILTPELVKKLKGVIGEP